MMKGEDAWKKAFPGQTVKIRGVGPIDDVNPTLLGCELIEVSGPRPVTFTAEQLAKEHQADPTKLGEVYNRNYIIIKGEILKIELDKLNMPWVTFKTSVGLPSVFAVFTQPNFDKAITAGVRPSPTVTILGQFFYDARGVGVTRSAVLE